jgi:ubiquinone/menaquinone biosynthesis C-methylase UbiE
MSRSKDWKNFWDERSEKATSDFNFDRGVSPRETEIECLSQRELLHFIDSKPNEVIFDAGCGTGANILLLHSKVKRIIGMDYSKGAVERCQRRINSGAIRNVEVMYGSITQLPLSVGSIDKVLCMSVLQYMDDEEIRRALREFRRILNDDGVLVLHVKNLSSLYHSTLWAAKRIRLLFGRPTKLEYFRSFRWYINTLDSFGFEIIDYNSLNLLMIDQMPSRLLLLFQRIELRNHNKGLFKIGFIRRHGSDLKIKVRLRRRCEREA